jgi:hypothetical protein
MDDAREEHAAGVVVGGNWYLLSTNSKFLLGRSWFSLERAIKS